MDLRKLKKLIDLVEESGICELEVSEGEEKVRIVRFAEQANTTRRAAAKALHYLELKLVERIGLPAYHGLRDAMRMDWGDPPRVPPEAIEEAARQSAQE